MRLSSRPGAGTTVEVLLPATTKAPRVAEPPTGGGDAGAGARILVVEDEDPVRAVVVRLLESWGHCVAQAESGEDALALLQGKEERFDLLLTDVMMPGMTGLELATRVRAMTPDQAVLFMSGYSQELLAGGTAGLGPVLSKPFGAPALRSAVASALRSPSALAG